MDRIAMLWLIISSLALALAGMLIFIYYFKKGQFDDMEDVKYQLFRNEED
jgi:cbb3-type cytochrome oxidase maturation protein